jgi:phosphoribosylaminoimidazolecarboxamide formyltransferase/IMP cyclohydrolase
MKEQKPTDITAAKKAYRARNEGDFPDELAVRLKKEWDLKYGENPNQHAAMYVLDLVGKNNTRTISELTNIQSVRSDSKGKGGLSLTNMMDICRAMDVLKYFMDEQAVVIMKHNIAAGFARQASYDRSQIELFRLARDADRRSNFGGAAVFTRPLDMETAKAMYELKGESPFFVDVAAAPCYEEGVLAYIESQSATVRIAEFEHLEKLPRFQGDETYGLMSFKEMPTGRIGVQDIYLTSIRAVDDLILYPMVKDKEGKEHVVKRTPSEEEIEDILTAWWLNLAGARSNGVVAVREGVSVAIGSGQVERVGAVEQMIVKGMQKAMDREGVKYDPLMGIQGYEGLDDNPFEGASVSSDAFFPFRDSIDRLARVGVTAVVQPYGSNRDAEVIDAANEHDMSAPATLERCFGHW